jgi:hypothetical protein
VSTIFLVKAKMPATFFPSGTIIRIRSKDDVNKITALVTKSGSVRLLRLNNKTCAGGILLGTYKNVDELLSSVDKKWRIETTDPRGFVSEYEEKDLPVASKSVCQPSHPKPKAGDMLKAVDNQTKLAISAVLLTNGNVLLVKYGDMPCTDFKVQYEYTMSQFMETYGIEKDEIIVS